ncbi:MAG: ATP-dependent zinc metalloprotease FtsH [Planctomycetes bacterium]|nr:ATP-dependent zinc metalloprotease FtsH [Planctomycetota bacterium]
MAEPKTPQNDNSKKSRSFGSFALFLFILVALLLVLGGNNLVKPREELSQDAYEWKLYTGQVDSQQFSGTNEIEGQLVSGTYFSVHFADIAKREAEYTAIKAAAPYQSITSAELKRAVDEGWYRPLSARVLISKLQTATEGAQREAKNGVAGVHQQTATSQSQGARVQVQVSARPLSAWKAKETTPPPFYLPNTDEGAIAWVEVEKTDDLSATLALLEANNVKPDVREFHVSKDKGSTWTSENSLLMSVFLVLGPWILLLVVFFIIMRQMRSQGAAGGVMNFGRSRAQLYSKENHTNVTFDDVAGADEAKDEVREIVEFLKNPGRFTRVGGRIPRGVLLVGSPGCGKTLLAKAIAGEAEVPFFSISGSDFVEMFVGVGASRVRDLFKQARENSPCIIFLDEIDAVGRRRGSGMGGGHDEREQTLNAILVEMDGFGTDEGIIVVAATNRPDVLDPALLRPGRFDREVVIDLPDVQGREEILRVHMKKVKAGSDIDLAALARSTPGRSGAELAAIINEAAIMAVLQKKDEVGQEHLEEARDKVSYGRQKKSRKLEEEDRKITAYHEAGHAVVASAIAEVDPPTKVTIVPRGRALGATFMVPDKESYHMQKRRMIGQLAVAFGGRVAEAQFCGDISAGASDDIRRATELARAMVTELGMSEKIGPINYAERQGSDFLGTELMSGKWHSEDTAREIDQEVQGLLKAAYEHAVAIIKQYTAGVEAITAALLRYETISGDDVKRLMSGASVDSLRPNAPHKPVGGQTGVERPATTPAPKVQSGDLPGSAGLSPA